MQDKLEKDGEYWTVYRYSDAYGKCPIFKSKNKSDALKHIKQ